MIWVRSSLLTQQPLYVRANQSWNIMKSVNDLLTCTRFSSGESRPLVVKTHSIIEININLQHFQWQIHMIKINWVATEMVQVNFDRTSGSKTWWYKINNDYNELVFYITILTELQHHYIILKKNNNGSLDVYDCRKQLQTSL